jgi:cytochrome oxidase Cu insertion factor (SCO1/SenC/PrrC family)
MRHLLLACALGVTVSVVVGQTPTTRPAGGATTRPASEKSSHAAAVTAASATSPLDFTLPDITGQETALAKYKGHVVLIVNVASKCGLTPQYEQLQALHEKYAARGLRIVAIPANNFGN